MLRWTAIVLSLLVGTSAALAQGFSAFIYYDDSGGPPLTTTCEGSTPIPDGRMIKIFWDQNSNGPDPTDPRPVLCDPPDCLSPLGSVNYIEMPFNGVSTELGAGYFVTEVNLYSVGAMPNPPRYYFRIYDTDDTTILWTSDVLTMVQGPQDIGMTRSQWRCGSEGPQCVVRDERE